MERMTPAARHIGMMLRRQVRRGLVAAGAWGLLGVALAGCGSVAASAGSPAPGASAPAGGAASTPTTAQVGCASVNQATMVTVSRLSHLMQPRPDGALLVADRKPALVRALFRDFCQAVTHPDVPPGMAGCQAGFVTSYAGVFYDGNRVLARYTYAASGCKRVGIIVGSTTQSTILAGRAADAAPHLAADFGAVLDSAKPGAVPWSYQVNPGGPDQQA